MWEPVIQCYVAVNLNIVRVCVCACAHLKFLIGIVKVFDIDLMSYSLKKKKFYEKLNIKRYFWGLTLHIL